MAQLTLGQMLDAALRDPKTEPIDFEQLRNLLNGLLMQLGLKDVAVQENGEPLEGTPKTPFAVSMAEDLMERVEANERAIAELRGLLEELREDTNKLKEEQSLLAENFREMEESLDLTGMMENVRNELLNAVMSMIREAIGDDGQISPDWQQKDLSDDGQLIVIGTEIILEERPRTPRQWDAQASKSKDNSLESDVGQDGVDYNDVGQIKVEGTDMSISKASPSVQTKSTFCPCTGLPFCPGPPSIQTPTQKVQSAQGHPAPQTTWIPAESVPGTNIGSPPASPGRPGHSDVLYTPPPSPGLTAHLTRQSQEHRQRELAGEGYSRRSPMYCGGRHTSNCPVQPMESLLPDPNKPGEFELVGRDGLIYRGRQYGPPTGSWTEEGDYSRMQ